MRKRFINGQEFTAMIISAAALLRQRAEEVNRLNVFPVPDGDTGSNMSRTMQAGMQHMQANEYTDIGDVAKALAEGMLMGARGNSGVILSQLFQGFAQAVQGEQSLTVKLWAEALQAGVEAAYRAVANPVEGTVLTVAREAAAFGLSTASSWDDPIEWWTGVVEKAKIALAATPEQLPVLKQAGVVDSGGQGLVYVYEGFLAACRGEAIVYELADSDALAVEEEAPAPEISGVEAASIDEIEHFYDMEFFIRIDDTNDRSDDEVKLREQLSQIGDSVLVISGQELVKVHVHSSSPGDVLNIALAYGELTQIHVENMRDQHVAWLQSEQSKQPRRKQAIVAVSAGAGLTKILQSLGSTRVVTGGQSMNPSVDELLRAVREANAESVFLLPNNRNILLAAQRTAELAEGVRLIPTESIPQGMSALLAFGENETVESNEQAMQAELTAVKSGYITYAVKDSSYGELNIKKDDILGVSEGEIVKVGQALEIVCCELIEQMIGEEDELVTLMFGEEVSKEQAERLVEILEKQFSAIEFELLEGGQPLHHFIISIE